MLANLILGAATQQLLLANELRFLAFCPTTSSQIVSTTGKGGASNAVGGGHAVVVSVDVAILITISQDRPLKSNSSGPTHAGDWEREKYVKYIGKRVREGTTQFILCVFVKLYSQFY